MRRYILSLPADLAMVDESGNPILPGTVIYPMPGTEEVAGRKLADVYTEYGDLFPESCIVLACQEQSGEFITPLDESEFIRYLAPVVEYGEAGEVVSSIPATLHQPHVMGGWPDITQPASEPAITVPEAVSMRQARLALLGAGLLQTVDDAVTMMPDQEGEAARIEWNYSKDVHRDSPMVARLSAALGLDAAMLDSLFVVGSRL